METGGSSESPPEPKKGKSKTPRKPKESVLKQKSPAEFFAENKNIAGFDNPGKCLYTTVRELVENALDSAESISELPVVEIIIEEIGKSKFNSMIGLVDRERIDQELYDDYETAKAREKRLAKQARDQEIQAKNAALGKKVKESASKTIRGRGEASFYRVICKDNGRGMPHDDIPNMFGRVLSGTKYGLKQTRGKFGLGAKMALIWSKMSTGLPIEISSAMKGQNFISFCRLDIDIHRNIPHVHLHEKRENKDHWHGAEIQVVIEGNWTTYRSKILHYMRQMAVITPYAQFLFKFVSETSDKNVTIRFARRTDVMPPVPMETKYHPSAVDLLLIKRLQNPPFPPPPTNSWFERFLLDNGDSYPRWVETFRMSKSTFYVLSSTLSEHLSSSLPSIPPNFALGAALYRLAHNGSFCSVGRRFGLTSADACRAFYTVCKVICSQMGGYLGEFGSDMGKISKGFEGISLPNCCGVLGMEKFWVHGKVLGENGFLIVQALVDSEGRFLDVSAGWPGTFSPASIFPQTRLFLGVEESKELLNGSPYELSDGDLLPQYILGDSCYPLLPWLLTPFEKRGRKQDWGLKEMEFNYVHKRAMGFVRMAFGRVRANWELLNRRWKEESVEFLPFIITTACLLNNFLMKHGETLPDGQPRHDEEHSFPVFEGEVSESAVRTRDLLAMHLSWVSQRH